MCAAGAGVFLFSAFVAIGSLVLASIFGMASGVAAIPMLFSAVVAVAAMVCVTVDGWRFHKR